MLNNSFSIVPVQPGQEITQAKEAIARHERTGHITYLVVAGLALPITAEATQQFANLTNKNRPCLT